MANCRDAARRVCVNEMPVVSDSFLTQRKQHGRGRVCLAPTGLPHRSYLTARNDAKRETKAESLTSLAWGIALRNHSNHINQKNHSSDNFSGLPRHSYLTARNDAKRETKAESLTSLAWGIALRNHSNHINQTNHSSDKK